MTPRQAWVTSSDRRRWRSARTLTDLGHLMAAWLEGDIATSPTYGDTAPADETISLVPTLTAACRAGYVTTNSQPGQPPELGYAGRIWHQRAAVTGWIADEVLLGRIHHEAAAAGVLVVATAPGRSTRHGIPAVTSDGETTLAFGSSPGHRRMISSVWGGSLNGTARRHLRAATILTLVDPEWGRNTVLWPLLNTAAAQPATA